MREKQTKAMLFTIHLQQWQWLLEPFGQQIYQRRNKVEI